MGWGIAGGLGDRWWVGGSLVGWGMDGGLGDRWWVGGWMVGWGMFGPGGVGDAMKPGAFCLLGWCLWLPWPEANTISSLF